MKSKDFLINEVAEMLELLENGVPDESKLYLWQRVQTFAFILDNDLPKVYEERIDFIYGINLVLKHIK
ncbi:MAG TPA: hypothetical protein VJ845_00555 [Haploplasma sp.]|nr:hypothetical protein [Haploplasma sp.]